MVSVKSEGNWRGDEADAKLLVESVRNVAGAAVLSVTAEMKCQHAGMAIMREKQVGQNRQGTRVQEARGRMCM